MNIIANKQKNEKGLTKMAFNPDLNLYQNVKMGLLVQGKSLDTVAKEIKTTTGSIKNRIGAKFLRNGKSTPLDSRIYEYLKKNCNGFQTYCRANKIKIVS